jgi:hypothetical protein
MTDSQMGPGYTVLCKAGKQTLEQDGAGRLVVTDGWLTDWIILYAHRPNWAQDGVLSINKPIRQMLDKLAYEEYMKGAGV